MPQRSLMTCIVTLLLLCLTSTLARATAPTITSFAPNRGVVGTVVTITGTNLNGATTVAFNGVLVKAFSCNSATSLFALVPVGATSGKITVTNASGTAISVTDFVVLFLMNNPQDSASMVWVPGGTFTMGCADGVGWVPEHPAHQVTLSGYWIYQYDVTVAQYRAFCAATKHKLPSFPQPMVEYPSNRFDSNLSWAGKTGWDDPALQQHPIVNVTWNDAKAYADWAGVTLPTEAQWEYAARGPRENNYPWGGTATKDDMDNGWDATKYASWENSFNVGKSTLPMGSFPAGASWCGAQDMAGNVWQWCSDWYNDYAAAAVTDPTGPAIGTRRVDRGGSWYCYGSFSHIYIRSAYRADHDPDGYDSQTGFRCASITPEPRLADTFARTAALTITTIAPTSAVVGSVITITGTDLDNTTTVTLNGIAAKTITDNTATALEVTVPEGATSGKLTVTTAGGTVTNSYDFIVLLGLMTNAKDNAEMVWVPSNTFTMGSETGVGCNDEHPAHQVTLSGYWIYQYDVTVVQYHTFCAATGYALPKFPSGYSWSGKTGWDDPTLQQHPIVNVSWKDAKAYADWAGVALPTEAQWEYAARGPQGRNFPWGGIATADDWINGWDATKCANYFNSYVLHKSTWPVGSFPVGASWCGAKDMAGNVFQWCGDWYGNYAAAAVTDPTGPAMGKYRILRGGSWYDVDNDYSRCAYRSDYDPIDCSIAVGFRCVSLSPGP